MESMPVQPDEWTWCIPDRLCFLLGADPLMDAGYAPALEVGIDTNPVGYPGYELLETRTRAPMPAGWAFHFLYPKRLFLPALSEWVRSGEFRRRTGPPGHARRLITKAEIDRALYGPNPEETPT